MKKIFWITLILCLIMPMCVYAVDGSYFDADQDGDVDGEDLSGFSHYFGKLCWYKDADEDGISDGTKVWAVSRPAGYYLADELTVLFGDPNDNVYDDGVRDGPITVNRAEFNALRGIVEVNGDLTIGGGEVISLRGLGFWFWLAGIWLFR